MQSIDVISDFLKDRLGASPENMTLESTLADLGVDSLMLAELMFEAEDRLGIEISSDETPPKTVGDMVVIMDRLLARKAA